MRKINITIMCEGEEAYPRCVDLLETCPEVSVVAQISGTCEPGAGEALGCSDILILDEAAVEQAGFQALRCLQFDHSRLKSLLLTEKDNINNMIAAASLGIKGVVARDSMVSELRKALTALCSGEAWMPRSLAGPLRDELIAVEKLAHWSKQSSAQSGCDRLN